MTQKAAPLRTSYRWAALIIAVPPLLMALLGPTHPTNLTAGNAHHWTSLHLLPIPYWP